MNKPELTDKSLMERANAVIQLAAKHPESHAAQLDAAINEIALRELHERARRKVKELEFAITQSAFTSIRDGLEEELELARIALASLNATPIYQVQYGQQWRDVSKEVYEDHRDHGSSTRIVYAEPPAPVTGIYDDVLNIIGLLENNEWAEHCTSTVLGSILESEITRLVSKEPPAPLSDAEREELNRLRIATCDHGLGSAHTQGVIGCERCAGCMVYAWEPIES